MMTEHKWTPGPWRVFGGDKVVTVGPHCKLVAETDPANAHLIAAAPDLYEALCIMIEYCNAEPGTMVYPGTQAATALAKARGEA